MKRALGDVVAKTIPQVLVHLWAKACVQKGPAPSQVTVGVEDIHGALADPDLTLTYPLN